MRRVAALLSVAVLLAGCGSLNVGRAIGPQATAAPSSLTIDEVFAAFRDHGLRVDADAGAIDDEFPPGMTETRNLLRRAAIFVYSFDTHQNALAFANRDTGSTHYFVRRNIVLRYQATNDLLLQPYIAVLVSLP